jgi:hypothetical protein
LLFTDFFDQWTNDDFREFIYNDDYVLVDPDYTGVRSVQNATFFANIFEPVKDAIALLDYGGGQGGFAQELRSHGFGDTCSYDPYGEHQELSDGTFDVVTAFEVVEHSIDPERTLDEILAKVSAGGVAIIGQTMQPDNIDEIRDRWWYIAPRNGHVTFYSHRTLLSFARSRGVLYRNFGGWFALHRPTISDSTKRMLARLPGEIGFMDLGAPPAQAGLLGEWHDVEEHTGDPYRWTGSREMPLGDHLFQSNRTALSIRYFMAVEEDFVNNCSLRIGSETFPLRTQSSKELVSTVLLDKPGRYHVTLLTPPPRCPSALGLNADDRELGMAIYCQP